MDRSALVPVLVLLTLAQLLPPLGSAGPVPVKATQTLLVNEPVPVC